MTNISALKWLVLVAGSLLIFPPPDARAEQIPPWERAKRISDAAAPKDKQKPSTFLGTAFFYNGAGDMFTNRHVVEHCDRDTISVRLYDGSIRKALKLLQ